MRFAELEAGSLLRKPREQHIFKTACVQVSAQRDLRRFEAGERSCRRIFVVLNDCCALFLRHVDVRQQLDVGNVLSNEGKGLRQVM